MTAATESSVLVYEVECSHERRTQGLFIPAASRQSKGLSLELDLSARPGNVPGRRRD